MKASERVKASVVKVIDGDTIEVDIAGETYTVRYIGIDTPETKHPEKPVQLMGPEAASKNEELVGGKVVELERDVSETDKYGRLLRYVWVGDLMVNAELVRLGYASVSTYPPDVKYTDLFLQLQRQAREDGRGLWETEPTPTKEPSITPAPEPTTSPPTQAPVGSDIQITFIFYDGVVYRVESDEYVEIRNQGSGPQDMTGWRLVSLQGDQSFYFPGGFVMQAGQVCRICTNEDHPESCGLKFGSGQAVWNNKGDAAALYNEASQLVSQYNY